MESSAHHGGSDWKPPTASPLRAWLTRSADEPAQRLPDSLEDRPDEDEWHMLIEDGSLNQTVSGPADSLVVLAVVRRVEELHVYSSTEKDFLRYVPRGFHDREDTPAQDPLQRHWLATYYLSQRSAHPRESSWTREAPAAWLLNVADEHEYFADVDFEGVSAGDDHWRLVIQGAPGHDVVEGGREALLRLANASHVQECYVWSAQTTRYESHREDSDG